MELEQGKKRGLRSTWNHGGGEKAGEKQSAKADFLSA
jgi:hypothetical protein